MTATLTARGDASPPASSDERLAVIVLDAKGDLVESALSVVPPDRTVHVVDFARPEAGIDAWSSSLGDFDAITDVIVQGLIDVSRTEDDESQILASSYEFLVSSCLATLATASRPSFQHMRSWLGTSDAEIGWRERQLPSIARRPELVEVVKFFESFHDRLRKAQSAFVQRAAAPHNKVGRLLRGSIDKVLRHPYAIDIDRVIREREVLIVDGAIGSVREAPTVLRFIVQMVHQAIQRQQELPESERVKVLLIADEAPVLLTPTVADMMAQDRSAGLMFCAAWQHNGQVENKKVLSSIEALLGSRYVFRTRDEDARRAANLFQVSYDDRLGSDLADVRRQRIGPAAILNLPRWRAAAVQVADGARTGSYIGETLPMRIDQERIKHHRDAQRRRGGFHPEVLLPPEMLERDRERGRKYDLSEEELEHARRVAAMRGEEGIYEHGEPARQVEEPDGEGGKSEAGAEPADEGDGGHDEAVKRSARASVPAVPEGKNGRAETDVDMGAWSPGDSEEKSADETTSNRRAPSGKPGGAKAGPRDAAAEQGEGARRSVVGPIGKPLPGPVSDLLVELDAFESSRMVELEEGGVPPSGLDERKRARWAKGALVPLERGKAKLPMQGAARRRLAAEVAKELRADQLRMLRELYLLGYLTGRQLVVGPFAGVSRTTISRATTQLRASALVDVIRIGGRDGKIPYIYRLTELGFEVGKAAVDRDGAVIPERAVWRERLGLEPQRIVHDLHAVAWLYQLRALAPEVVARYRGEHEGEIEVPRQRIGRQWKQVELEALGTLTESPGNLAQAPFTALRPDLTIELEGVRRSDGRNRGELLVELDRSGHRAKLTDKLRRYDAFYTAWGRATKRVEQLGWPATVFVSTDERALRRLLAMADQLLEGHVVQKGRPEAEWPSPARERIFFAVERDIHQGSARCYRVALHPPRIRAMVARSRKERQVASQVQPVAAEFLPASYLGAGGR